MLFLRKVDLKNLLLISFVSLFFAFLFFTYLIFLFTLTSLFIGFILIIYIKHKSGNLIKGDLYYVVSLFSVFAVVIIVIVSRNLAVINSFVSVLVLFLTISILGICIIILVLSKPKIVFSKKKFIEYLPIIIMMLLVSALSYDAFLYKPLDFDSNCYLNDLSRISLENLNNRDFLKLYGHMTHMYSLVVYFLSCIVGSVFVASILFNVLCLVFALPVIYRIIKILCPNCNNWFAYLCVACFAFSPFTFGHVGYIYNQTSLMYSVLFFIFAYLLKDEILMLVTSSMVIFSFETGMLVLVAFVYLPILYTLVKSVYIKTLGKEIKKQALNLFNICSSLLCIIFVFIYCERNWGFGAYETGALGGGSSMSWRFIRSLILLINFSWIPLIFIVIAGVKLAFDIFAKKRPLGDYNNFIYLFIVNSIVLFGLYLVLYFSLQIYVNVRYILPMIICMYLLFFVSLHYLLNQIKIKKLQIVSFAIVLGFFAVLLCIQAYFTIDPVMLSSQRKIYMGSGNNYILTHTGTRDTDFWSDFYMCDGSVYNKQMQNYSIACNLAFKSINYSDTVCVITGFNIMNWVMEAWSWKDTGGIEWSWSKDTKKINNVVCKDGSDISKLLIDTNGTYTEYWFLDYNARITPHIEDYIKDFIELKIDSSHDISYRGWRFTLSKIRRII